MGYHTAFRRRCLNLVNNACPVEDSMVIGIQTFPRKWGDQTINWDVNIMFTDPFKQSAQDLANNFYQRGLSASFNTPYSGRKEDGNALHYLESCAGKRDRLTLMFRADLLEIPYFRLTVLKALGDALVQLGKVVRVSKSFADAG